MTVEKLNTYHLDINECEEKTSICEQTTVGSEGSRDGNREIACYNVAGSHLCSNYYCKEDPQGKNKKLGNEGCCQNTG